MSMRTLGYTVLIGLSGLVGGLGACANATTSDLPAGWQDAERLDKDKLMQMTCSHSGLEDVPETLSQGELSSELEVTYDNALFRCEQPVEGYVRSHESAVDVLVQPVDMNPDAVAGCDCRYTIEMQVPVVAQTHELTVYRRWDNLNSPNNPVRIGALQF